MTGLRTGLFCLAFAMMVIAILPGRLSAEAGDAAALDKAREMIEVTGAAAAAEQAIQLSLPPMRQLIEKLNPGQGQLIGKLLEEHFTPAIKKRLPEFIDISAKIYASHFNAAELEEILEFYRTDVGQKLIEKLPLLTRESIVAGQLWARQVAQDTFRELVPILKEKGLKTPEI